MGTRFELKSRRYVSQAKVITKSKIIYERSVVFIDIILREEENLNSKINLLLSIHGCEKIHFFSLKKQHSVFWMHKCNAVKSVIGKYLSFFFY